MTQKDNSPQCLTNVTGDSPGLLTFHHEAPLYRWLLQYMRSREQRHYPRHLIDYAEWIFEMLMPGDGPALDIKPVGHIFPALDTTSGFRSYSLLLMECAGRLHEALMLGNVEADELVYITIESARLSEEIRLIQDEERIIWLKSTSAFEQRHGVRVEIDMDVIMD